MASNIIHKTFERSGFAAYLQEKHQLLQLQGNHLRQHSVSAMH